MRLSLTAAALAALALSACNKTDTAPRPEHSDVATAMPDAAATPGAVGPATAAPHADPGPATTLSDVHPQPGEPKEFLGSSGSENMTEDYALIALVRGLEPSQSVLILAGNACSWR